MLRNVLNLDIRKNRGPGTPRWPVLLLAAFGFVFIAPVSVWLWSHRVPMLSVNDVYHFVLVALFATYLLIKTIAEIIPLREAANWRAQVEQERCTNCDYQLGKELAQCPECGHARTYPVALDSPPPASCFRGKGVLFERLFVSAVGLIGFMFSTVFYFVPEPKEVLAVYTGFWSALCLNAQLTPRYRKYLHVLIALVILGVSIASIFLPGDKKGWFGVFAFCALYSLWRNLYSSQRAPQATSGTRTTRHRN